MKYTGCYSREEIRHFYPPPNSVIISITDPDAVPAVIGPDGAPWDDCLRMKFWDVERELHYAGMILHPATDNEIKTIHDFIQKHKEKNIFVHCEAGISRSAGVREYLLRRGWFYYTGNGRRQVYPNRHVLTKLERLDYGNDSMAAVDGQSRREANI